MRRLFVFLLLALGLVSAAAQGLQPVPPSEVSPVATPVEPVLPEPTPEEKLTANPNDSAGIDAYAKQEIEAAESLLALSVPEADAKLANLERFLLKLKITETSPSSRRARVLGAISRKRQHIRVANIPDEQARDTFASNPDDTHALNSLMRAARDRFADIMKADREGAAQMLNELESFLKPLKPSESLAKRYHARAVQSIPDLRKQLEIAHTSFADYAARLAEHSDNEKALSGYMDKVHMELIPASYFDGPGSVKPLTEAKEFLASVAENWDGAPRSTLDFTLRKIDERLPKPKPEPMPAKPATEKSEPDSAPANTPPAPVEDAPTPPAP